MSCGKLSCCVSEARGCGFGSWLWFGFVVALVLVFILIFVVVLLVMLMGTVGVVFVEYEGHPRRIVEFVRRRESQSCDEIINRRNRRKQPLLKMCVEVSKQYMAPSK